MKKLVMALMCVLCSLFVYTGTAQAADVKSSYTVNLGSHAENKVIKIKGGTKKTIKLNVKEAGKLKLNITSEHDDGYYLKGKEQVKVQILDSKSKALSTKYLSSSNRDCYSSLDLKKGTYRVVITTKNIKKTTSRDQVFGFTFNKTATLRTDGKKVYDMLNGNGDGRIKFVNDKDQTISIDCHYYESEYCDYNVRDINGNIVFYDSTTHNGGAGSHYLPKGTYYVELDGNKYEVASYVVSVSPGMNKVKMLGSSRDNALLYNGEEQYITDKRCSGHAERGWLKVDTTKRGYAFQVRDGYSKYYDEHDYSYPAKLYREDGTKIDFDKEIQLPKGTGNYYIAIENVGMRVLNLHPVAMEETAKSIGSMQTNKGMISLYKGHEDFSVVSSENKEISGEFTLDDTFYMQAKVNDGSRQKLISIYDVNNQEILAGTDGYVKLNKGTYTFKEVVTNANVEYSCFIRVYDTNYMEKTLNKFATKTKTVELSGVKVDEIYSLYAELPLSNENVTIKLYENGKKIEEGTNGIYFVPKKAKRYAVVFSTSTANHYVNYGYMTVGRKLYEANSELRDSKKAAIRQTSKFNTEFKKGYSLKGKFSNWVKISALRNADTRIRLHSFISQGKVTVKVYNSNGTLKSTMKIDKSNGGTSIEIPRNETYYFNISSTDAKTSCKLRFR